MHDKDFQYDTMRRLVCRFLLPFNMISESISLSHSVRFFGLMKTNYENALLGVLNQNAMIFSGSNVLLRDLTSF